MYRKFSLIMLVFVVLSLFTGFIAYTPNPVNVVDHVGYLTDNEIQQLQARIDKIKDRYKLDVVIVITDNTNGKSSMKYADDYYDYNDYGVDDKDSGLLMLINMQDREVWISTHARAIDIYTDSRISGMVNGITSYLSNGYYYDACNAFIDDVIKYAKYSDTSYGGKVSRMLKSWPVYVIPLVISIVSTLVITGNSKGEVTTSTRTYEEAGSFTLTQNTDMYLRETTTRTKIQSQPPSGGGGGHSTTHKSSSGRTHGGGGGKF